MVLEVFVMVKVEESLKVFLRTSEFFEMVECLGRRVRIPRESRKPCRTKMKDVVADLMSIA